MKSYIGTKLINGTPMTRLEYNNFRGWVLPSDEEADDGGYLVEYLDGGKPNTNTYAGYISWSPKEQFENAYRLTDGISFGLAIEAMKKGLKVALPHWGKDVYIQIQTPSENSKMTSPYFYVTSRYGMVPWNATQIEQLSDDWMIID